MIELLVAASYNRFVDRVLQRMAEYVRDDRTPNRTDKNYCHQITATGIKANPDPANKIWIFLTGSAGMAVHSLLTDAHNHVLVDSYLGNAGGRFDPVKGYYLPHSGEWIDTFVTIRVADFLRQYVGNADTAKQIKLLEVADTQQYRNHPLIGQHFGPNLAVTSVEVDPADMFGTGVRHYLVLENRDGKQAYVNALGAATKAVKDLYGEVHIMVQIQRGQVTLDWYSKVLTNGQAEEQGS